MSFQHPEYLGPSIIALILALYPLPWHLRTRNIVTLSMIFWMTALNTIHTINCIIWVDNATPRANVWCDISATVYVAYNFALPTAHLLLAKQLESYTSLRSHSPLYDLRARRRHQIFDLSISVAAPVIGTVVHLSNMDRRFYVVESVGPMPATYWNTWGVVWMAVVPILIAATCAVYTIMAIVNIYLRRQKLLALIASDASVNRDQFVRLMFLTIAELGTCGLRAIFNLMSFQNGPQPLGHYGPPEHNLSRIESIPASMITKKMRLNLDLQFFTVVACSMVFFLCFATSIETKKFYYNVVRRIVPCIPEPREGHLRLFSSMGSGSGLSSTSSRTNPTGSSSSSGGRFLTIAGASTHKDVDISLEEMLDTPQFDKSGNYLSRGMMGSSIKTDVSESKYDEETAEALYLPPMQTDEKSK
ncbi:hypothetical protein IAR55_000656 [Kwoniella newhampshirensis]|uniref:Pheromone a factor receptor n=1 Tax=Kwoniella newhampshirensis TaxID=1651941 RepID=A0AAW0Z7J3_9TREE